MSRASQSNGGAGAGAHAKPGNRERAALEQRGSALVRALVGGAVAVLAALYWLVRELGLDQAELLDFALTSVVFIAVFAIPGIAVGALFVFLRRRRGG
jgi:heme/copper-type cytochrome/quinol oxidase subunit 1